MNLGVPWVFTGLDYNDEITVSKKVNELTPIISKKFGVHPDEIVTVTQHHALHALCGFYNSGFEDACVVVVDGMGNHVDYDYHEAESIFNVKYPSDATLLARNVCARSDSNNIQLRDIHGEWPIGIGMVYASISSYLGFGSLGVVKLWDLLHMEDMMITSNPSFLRMDQLILDCSTELLVEQTLFHMIIFQLIGNLQNGMRRCKGLQT